MAATKTVPHLRSVRNSAQPADEVPATRQLVPETIQPRRGIITLYGYGITTVRLKRFQTEQAWRNQLDGPGW
jgi:hypothetical protein